MKLVCILPILCSAAYAQEDYSYLIKETVIPEDGEGLMYEKDYARYYDMQVGLKVGDVVNGMIYHPGLGKNNEDGSVTISRSYYISQHEKRGYEINFPANAVGDINLGTLDLLDMTVKSIVVRTGMRCITLEVK